MMLKVHLYSGTGVKGRGHEAFLEIGFGIFQVLWKCPLPGQWPERTSPTVAVVTARFVHALLSCLHVRVKSPTPVVSDSLGCYEL